MLIGGKTLAVLLLELVQVVLICAFGLALGWHPHGDPALRRCCSSCSAPLAFGGLGLLLAGTLRAEVTLAAANLVWLVLLFAGGIAIPLDKYPARRRATCCSTCRRPRCRTGCTAVLQHGAAAARCTTVLTLLVWAARRAARRRPVVPVGVSTPVRAEPPAAAARRAGCRGGCRPTLRCAGWRWRR